MSEPATPPTVPDTPRQVPAPPTAAEQRPKEIGGPAGLEPTRYGDWEHKGRCTDF
jgi:hypothetical protein